jgi:sulfur-oxidizing protein SoxZ
VPAAPAGEIIEIKALVQHSWRPDFATPGRGGIPRDIITSFVCTYNGAEIFSADLPPDRREPLPRVYDARRRQRHHRCKWTGDNGYSLTESVPITVA